MYAVQHSRHKLMVPDARSCRYTTLMMCFSSDFKLLFHTIFKTFHPDLNLSLMVSSGMAHFVCSEITCL